MGCEAAGAEASRAKQGKIFMGVEVDMCLF